MSEGAKKKRLYLKTFGCQMNVYDSERMIDLMAPHGFVLSEEYDNSELIILNTCHIREKAAEKVYSDLGRLVPLKRKAISEGKNFKIVVAGCVAQAEGEEIIKRQPAVDIVVGPQTYHKLPELLLNNLKSSRSVVATEFPTESKFDDLLIDKINDNPTSFVSVQEGCDKFCSFCVVPYTRGAEYSRPVQDIIKEINILVSKGAKEICLLGQNVNAYHGLMGKKSWSLSRLIKEIAEIENLKRIRYTTSHPADMTQDLVDAHGQIEQLMPYLHLPIQSGDDLILKAMNRNYKVEDYISIINRLRLVRPDIALSSDFIVGFPGESEQAFKNTLNLIEAVEFSQSYSFKYSRRPGTPASIMQGQIEEKLKLERLLVLQEVLNSQQLNFNKSFVNTKMEILLERKGRKDNQLVGRTPYMQATHIENNASSIGEIVEVMIDGATKNSLKGNFINSRVENYN